MKIRLLVAAAGLLAVDLPAQGRVLRPMTFDDFAAVKNVGDPQLSPNGAWVLYSLRTTDVNANKRTTVTILAPVGESRMIRVRPAPVCTPASFRTRRLRRARLAGRLTENAWHTYPAANSGLPTPVAPMPGRYRT